MTKNSVTESPIEGVVCKLAEEAGWLVRKVSWLGRRAAPDRLFAKGGRVVLIEFKRPGTAFATLQQQLEHKRLTSSGIEVHVCDSISSGLSALGVAL